MVKVTVHMASRYLTDFLVDQPQHSKMTYTRRGLGTAFVAFLCIFEAISVTVLSLLIFMGHEIIESLLVTIFREKHTSEFSLALMLPFILMDVLLAFKLAFHSWMLFDPKLTAGNGNKLKLNIFVIVAVFLNYLLIIMLHNTENYSAKYMFFMSIFCLPGFSAILERFIFGLSDESESCLKNLKPWEDSNQDSSFSKA
jgi:hypothetical protein